MFREASAYEKVMKQSEAPPSHREESNPHLWIKTRMLEKESKSEKCAILNETKELFRG